MGKIKFILTVMCAMIVLLSIDIQAADQYVISDNGLKLRMEPTEKSESIITIPYKEKLNVRYSVNGWARVDYDDYKGYVKEEYLSEDDPLENMEYLGNWHTTAYAYTGSPCANGNMPSTGYTIACNSLDFGTKVYIDSVGMRVVEDRGPESLGSEWLDIYMGDVNSCIQWGSQYRDVYLVKDEPEN